MKEWTISQLEQTFGIRRMSNYLYYVKGWNIIGDQYEIIDKKVIIEDDPYNEVMDKYNKFLGKGFFDYNSNKYYKFYKRSEYIEIQKKLEELEIAEKEKEERINAQREKFLLEVNQFKEDNTNWKDSNWIKQNIGDYTNCTKIEDMIFIEYFWTIIGDNYKKADWKQNIKIKDSIYNRIKEHRYGDMFLNKKFKNDKGYNAKIIGTYKEDEELNGGVYGIYENGKLIYIGMTVRNFEERFQEHKDIILGKKSKPFGMILYNELTSLENLNFMPLIDIKNLKVDKHSLTRRDIEMMELAFIDYFKPKYNYEGIKKDYTIT